MKTVLGTIIIFFALAPVAWAFNCTMLEGAGQRLRDESFAQPLAAYYKYLYLDADTKDLCHVDDDFITVLNLAYLAYRKEVSYEDLCRHVVTNDLSPKLLVDLTENDGFISIYREFNSEHIDFPGFVTCKSVIESLDSDTPNCMRITLRFFEILDGYYREMLYDTLYILLRDKPDQSVHIIQELLPMKEGIQCFMDDLVEWEEYRRVKEAYAPYLASDSEHKENAVIIVDMFQHAAAAYRDYKNNSKEK